MKTKIFFGNLKNFINIFPELSTPAKFYSQNLSTLNLNFETFPTFITSTLHKNHKM
jgi:hypothetical protein